MAAYRIFRPGIIAVLLLAPPFTSGVRGAEDLPLGNEIERRFGEDAVAVDDELVLLEQTALRFTQSIGWHFACVGTVVVDESSGNVNRRVRSFVQCGNLFHAKGFGLRSPQLENDVELPHREPTLVESSIAEGFPAGTGESVVEDLPPSNHFVVYSNSFAFGGVGFSR